MQISVIVKAIGFVESNRVEPIKFVDQHVVSAVLSRLSRMTGTLKPPPRCVTYSGYRGIRLADQKTMITVFRELVHVIDTGPGGETERRLIDFDRDMERWLFSLIADEIPSGCATTMGNARGLIDSEVIEYRQPDW